MRVTLLETKETTILPTTNLKHFERNNTNYTKLVLKTKKYRMKIGNSYVVGIIDALADRREELSMPDNPKASKKCLIPPKLLLDSDSSRDSEGAKKITIKKN